MGGLKVVLQIVGVEFVRKAQAIHTKTRIR